MPYAVFRKCMSGSLYMKTPSASFANGHSFT